MTTPHPLLPPRLNAIAANIARGFGIDVDTTMIFMAQAVALAAGSTVCVQSPNGRTLGPGFNSAIVSKGAGFPRGALMALISPVTDIVAKVCQERRERSAVVTNNLYEAALTTRQEIRNRIEKSETELRAVHAKNSRADRLGERIIQQGQAAPDEMAAYRATGCDFEAELNLQNSIARDHDTLNLVEADLQTLSLAAAPGILADERDWKSVPNLSENSFDAEVFALCFSGLTQLSLLNKREILKIACALTSSQTGRPGLNVIACSTAEAFSQVLSNTAVRNSGMFSTFAFLETTEPGNCDPSAIEAACRDETWRHLCKSLFFARMSRTQKVLLLDHDGFQGYGAFRAWCRQEIAPVLRPYFEAWPDLCLRLALICSIILKADAIRADSIQGAAEYLKSRLPAAERLVERLIADETPEQQRESRIDRICRRLSNGPLTKRGVVRRMHRQDYGVVEKMIAEAMDAGRIERRGDFFYALNVSVSASAA
jgi:hypothetical protein